MSTRWGREPGAKMAPVSEEREGGWNSAGGGDWWESRREAGRIEGPEEAQVTGSVTSP